MSPARDERRQAVLGLLATRKELDAVQPGLPKSLLCGLLGDAERVADLLPARPVLAHQGSGASLSHVDVPAGLGEHVEDDLRVAARPPYGLAVAAGFEFLNRAGQEPVEDFARVFVALNLHASRVIDAPPPVKRS